MFPSSGYFRGVPCPFYVSGLCERPYCHFRHSRAETERAAKAETGPSYSTSNNPSYSTSVGSILKTVTESLASDSVPEHSPSLVKFSSSAPKLPIGLAEPKKTSSNLKKCDTDIADNGTRDLNDSLFIPSFSSTAPILPESENEPSVSIALLPPISGLPKGRKNLPSYVPTPKALASLVEKDCVPSYTPTPKSLGEDFEKKSGRIIEYDPLKNFAISNGHKSSDEDEAAFSSDEDNEATKVADGEGNLKETESNLENKEAQGLTSGDCKPTATEDDLTDSDEDDAWQASAEASSNVQEMSPSYSDLLTPSSFFTDKHTMVSSSGKDQSNYHDSQQKVLPKQSAQHGGKKSNLHSSSKEAKPEKICKNRDLQRSNSSKNASSSSSSSYSKSASSSSHKPSSSSSREKETTKKKSSSSSHGSSSVSHRDKSSRSQTLKSSSHTDIKSENHKSSHTDIKSENLKSSSHSDIKSDNHKSSSSSGKNKKSHSSLHRESDHRSKNSHNSFSKKPEAKSSQPSPLTASDKPQSSSSEKENKHSSSHQRSLHKSHSVSRSLSSTSTSSKSDKFRHSPADRSKSLDGKIRTDFSEHKSIREQKPVVITNSEVKKTSLVPKDSFKTEDKQHSLKTSEITNVKFEKSSKDKKSLTPKISSSLSSKRSKSRTKRESSSRSSKESCEGKKPYKRSKSGDGSDSDIEIIEPPPPLVYNVSDSDENDDHSINKVELEKNEEQTFSMDSDTELSTNNEVDLMTDSDTFDECLRIFQETERQMAEKLKRDRDKVHPDKRKAQEYQELESFESSEDLLVSIGKKRMAHKNSETISRKYKPLVSKKPRLSPAQIMHNRIIEMQKRALLRAAKREGRESELPSMLGEEKKSTTNGITVMGGGLPTASLLPRQNSSNISSCPVSTTSAGRFGISPSLLPPTGQRQRQAHAPSKALFSGEKTPQRRPASASSVNGIDKGKASSFSMSPNTFYSKKAPPSSGLSKSITVAGTASKTEKRKAHEPTLSNLKRPLIPADFGSKVPTNVRQRYLNLIIDEHLKFRPELEAFTKGEADEKAVYEKANNKNIYLGVAVNTIKRIRTEAAQFLPSTSKKPKMNHTGSHATQSHAATLGGPNAARQSFTLNRSKTSTISVPAKIEGKEFYNRLKTYILTEEQLRENGFPRPGLDGGSKVQFYKEEDIGESLKENERVCKRCGTRFNVTKDGTPISNGLCVYHYGSAYKKRVSGAIESRYGCCNEKGGSKGCQVASCHVHEQNKVDNRSGYMKTIPASSTSEKDYKVYALDCEMVYTKAGLELARVTVVGEDCEVVYESLVKPDTDIIDFNTRFSGITAADMKGVSTDIRGVQAVMLSMISDKTILMGHSLESDLVALKLIHSTVVDTSLVFPHRLGLPYKRALRNLMLDHLQKIIQSSDGGHDSKEDAVACMQLMVYKVKEDWKKESRRI